MNQSTALGTGPDWTSAFATSIDLIGGFAAIEMNLSEWRDEIGDQQVTTQEMVK